MHIKLLLYALADNLVYGNSTGDIEIANTNLLEASMYEEMPVTAIQIGGGGGTGHENTQTAGSTHATLTMYEYATLEPNGPMVINFLSDNNQSTLNIKLLLWNTPG